MTTTPPPPRLPSLSLPSRLSGVDAARGIAVLGMFAAHVGAVDGPFDWTRPSTWAALVDGRSSVLFAFCAGVSLVLMTVRRPDADPMRDRRRVLARAVALFAIGTALLFAPNGPLVILPTYAVLFVAAIPFLRLRLRWAVLAAACSLVVGPVLALVLAPVVDLGQGDAARILVTGYPAFSWFGIVLAGVVVARVGLDRGRTLVRLLVVGVLLAVLGYGGGVVAQHVFHVDPSSTKHVLTLPPPGDASDGASGGGSTPDSSPSSAEPSSAAPSSAAAALPPGVPAGAPIRAEDAPLPPVPWARLLDVEPHAGSTVELLGALGVAIAVTAACCLVARRLPGVLAPFTATGRLALTLYVGHVVAMSVWAALGEPGSDPAVPADLGGWTPFVVLALVSVVGALLWQRTGRSGPLESVVRWSSHRLDDRP
jgi:uncharacterized membrane protein YeiB